MFNTRRTVLFAFSIFAATTATAGEFCEGKADGNYADPDDCSQFVSCAAGGLIEATMSCPAGLQWNDDGQYCDWPENVTCPEDVVEDVVEEGWLEGSSCIAYGADLHFIHGYMSDRERSLELCEAACLDSDFTCCQVDNDNFCYGSYTTGTAPRVAHASFMP